MVREHNLYFAPSHTVPHEHRCEPSTVLHAGNLERNQLHWGTHRLIAYINMYTNITTGYEMGWDKAMPQGFWEHREEL